MKKNQLPLILAIDTSCDETSAAVTLGRIVLSNIIASQVNLHQAYGGVYPTLAKQAHQKKIKLVTEQALKRAGIKITDIDALAVTIGPGLAPALEVGIKFAQSMAEKYHKPLIAINHIEAHLFSVLALRKKRGLPIKKLISFKISKQKSPQNISPELFKQSLKTTDTSSSAFSNLFPILGLVFSGGHSQFILINHIGDYKILGETIDDALGEALDKVGRILGLGYPAAPVIEKLAKKGDKNSFEFPLPMTEVKSFDLSYSGLKTSAHRKIKELKAQKKLDQKTIVNFAASFQYASLRHLCYKLDKLLIKRQALSTTGKIKQFRQAWLGGGVASNIKLRQMIRNTLEPYSIELKIPFEKRLCSDNAAMIGITAAFKLQHPPSEKESKSIPFDRRPSWLISESL